MEQKELFLYPLTGKSTLSSVRVLPYTSEKTRKSLFAVLRRAIDSPSRILAIVTSFTWLLRDSSAREIGKFVNNSRRVYMLFSCIEIELLCCLRLYPNHSIRWQPPYSGFRCLSMP